ncbi:MAG TPA: hypothetical protein VFH15_06715 [Pyrinomonadaceae bacterium]|nr:hypothetical protein [Pyrinomonadaceae bacterium]
MPWRDSSPMDLKTQFIADYLRQTLSISELWVVTTRSVARPVTSGLPGFT